MKRIFKPILIIGTTVGLFVLAPQSLAQASANTANQWRNQWQQQATSGTQSLPNQVPPWNNGGPPQQTQPLLQNQPPQQNQQGQLQQQQPQTGTGNTINIVPTGPASSKQSIPNTPSSIDLLAAAQTIANSQTTSSGQNNGCTNQGSSFQNKQIIFNNNAGAPIQRIFILQNVTSYPILINYIQTMPSPQSSSGWQTRLDPGQAAALAMTQTNFPLSCIAYNPPQLGIIDCQSVVSVCAYPPQKNVVGSFWIATNQSLNNIRAAILQRHILQQQ